MQEVRYYEGLAFATNEMNERLKAGWRIHSFQMNTYEVGIHKRHIVMVVYEIDEIAYRID